MALIGTRKKTIRRRGRHEAFKLRLRRAAVIGACAIFAIWLGSWVYLSGSITKAGQWGKNQMLDASVSAGFAVDNILVEGRVHADAEVLKALINVQKGDPLFSFDPVEAQGLIERISWVRAAHVERRLPDTLYIRLEERKPLALHQQKKTLRVLDEKGEAIATDNVARFKDLIVVLGEGAPEKAPGFIAHLSAEPALFVRVRSAKFIDKRRWDVTLDSNVKVKLPEEDLGLALRRLALVQEDDGLLDKDLKSIDLREPDKIVVRTKPGKVHSYKAAFLPESNI